MARRIRDVIPDVLPHGPFSDTTTIALIGLAAKRELGCASVWPRRVFRHTKAHFKRKAKPIVFSIFGVAFGVPFPLSQDIVGLGDTP